MTDKFVSFTLGGMDFCVAVESVRQIVSKDNILDAPGANAYITGVISLRGDVVPVMDLRARLGLPGETAGRKRRIIVVEYGKSSYGLLVDEVRDILELACRGETGMSPADPGRRFRIVDLPGIFSVDKGRGEAEHPIHGAGRNE